MSTATTKKKEIETITKALAAFQDGASIEQIKRAAELDIELRTLQRRLAELMKQGVVIKSGEKRSAKWHLAKQATPDEEWSNDEPEELIPLTTRSKQILLHISKPIQQRKPVGYKIDFLLSYIPNEDAYLSKDEKAKLIKVGNTGKPDHPAGTYAKQILNRLLIDLSWNSSRLEGNTYSLLDTEKLIADGEKADNKSPMDAQMILNHKDAIEFIVQSADEIGINRYTILNLHALLSNNLLPDPAAPGRLRTFGVGVGNSVYTPLIIPQQIEEMFETMLIKAAKINDPFEQAFFIMVQLPYLQPFDDVNKRVSRLAANIPLNKLNLAPITFADVPKDLYLKGLLAVYELNDVTLLKDIFHWAYERSAAKHAAVRQSLGEPDPFRLKYREELKAVISEIISNTMTQYEVTDLLEEKTKGIPTADRFRFANEVRAELKALHEGNFARYRVTPSEFQRWKSNWNQT